MTVEFNKILSEKLGLDEESKTLVLEEWNNKLLEAREEIAAELREEFAQKFTHDKELIVKSMDKFLSEKITSEMEELAEDKKGLVAERVQYKARIKEHTELLNKFIQRQLVSELKEHRSERVELKKGMEVLENFVLKQLAEELKEFHSDKKALQEQRVILVRKGKKELVEAKNAFIKRAAKVIEENINKTLSSEMAQFKDDIKIARENDFGRQVFESVAATYMSSYLNEGSEVKKLQKKLTEAEGKISKVEDKLVKQTSLTESTNIKLRATKDRLQRSQTLDRLITPLGKEKRAVMTQLLESVQTADLEKAFNKYLPAVLKESGTVTQTSRVKKTLKESKLTERTGDRKSTPVQNADDVTDINELKRLAGI